MNNLNIAIATSRPNLREDPVRRLGMIVLATDLMSERDAQRLIPTERAVLHVTRVAYDNPTTPENLLKMAPRLTDAARLLVPGAALSAIGFNCMSGSVAIGDEAIDAAIGAAHPGVPVVTPARAALKAFEALSVRRIALMTPYIAETSAHVARWFGERDLDIVSSHCLGLEDDRDMARVSRDSIIGAAQEADCPDAEAVFLSCTALPALGTIGELEARLGKPVVSANQASFWLMRRHAEIEEPLDGFGRLLQGVDVAAYARC